MKFTNQTKDNWLDNMAYGIDAKFAILLGVPYSPCWKMGRKCVWYACITSHGSGGEIRPHNIFTGVVVLDGKYVYT